MRTLKATVVLLCYVVALSTPAFTTEKEAPLSSNTATGVKERIPKSLKGAKVVPGAFRIQKVTFKTVVLNNKTHLVAAVVFNRNVDASTVQENVNIRMLKKNDNNFWVDASTQNNIVRVKPSFVTWVCGEPLEKGIYKMYLRGTIKSADGVFLDCNGDGIGEGGNLPAYESQLYQSPIKDLENIDPEVIENLRDH